MKPIWDIGCLEVIINIHTPWQGNAMNRDQSLCAQQLQKLFLPATKSRGRETTKLLSST